MLQKSFPLIPGLQIQDDVAMDKSAKQIGNQTVLPQFWRNCPRMMQKVNLPMKSRQSIAKKTLFLSFYSSNEGRKLDNFLAAIEVRSRTIKLEGCPLPANVSQFLSSWIQIWPIASLCLCNCMSTNDKSELQISRVGRVTSSNQDSSKSCKLAKILEALTLLACFHFVHVFSSIVTTFCTCKQIFQQIFQENHLS